MVRPLPAMLRSKLDVHLLAARVESIRLCARLNPAAGGSDVYLSRSPSLFLRLQTSDFRLLTSDFICRTQPAASSGRDAQVAFLINKRLHRSSIHTAHSSKA